MANARKRIGQAPSPPSCPQLRACGPVGGATRVCPAGVLPGDVHRAGSPATNENSRRSQLDDGAHALLPGAKGRMPQKTSYVAGCSHDASRQHHQTVIGVAKMDLREADIARKEGGMFLTMQVADDLLAVLLLGPTDFETHLMCTQPPAAQRLSLVAWDVVVKDDHAALRTATSRTTPCRVSRAASRTAAAVSIPGYCRATSSGVHPVAINSRASATKIRVPRKMRRPPHTRVSVARCLPISSRAMIPVCAPSSRSETTASRCALQSQCRARNADESSRTPYTPC